MGQYTHSKTWSTLFDFYAESIEQEQNVDAALAFDKLRQSEAFEFVVEEKVDTSSVQERKEFKEARKVLDELYKLHLERIKKDQIETFLDAEDYRALSERYKDAKKRAICTPQLTKLAQDLFREKFRFDENNTERLVKYAKELGLMSDNVLTIKTSAKRRMKEKLENTVSRNEKKKKDWDEKHNVN